MKFNIKYNIMRRSPTVYFYIYYYYILYRENKNRTKTDSGN